MRRWNSRIAKSQTDDWLTLHLHYLAKQFLELKSEPNRKLAIYKNSHQRYLI